MNTQPIKTYNNHYETNKHTGLNKIDCDVTFCGEKTDKKTPVNPKFWQSLFIKQKDNKEEADLTEQEFKKGLEELDERCFKGESLDNFSSIIEPKDRQSVLERFRSLDTIQIYQELDEIKSYINPKTGKYNDTARNIARRIYDKGKMGHPAFKEVAINSAFACIDETTGEMNPLAIKFLNMFYLEEPIDTKGKLTDKFLEAYKSIKWGSLDFRHSFISHMLAQNIESLKDSGGSHNPRNFACMAKILCQDYNKFDGAYSIINYAKDENGVVDCTQFKKALKYLENGTFDTDCLELLSKIPSDRRYRTKDKILKYLKSNNLEYFEGWRTAQYILGYCLDKNGEINETKLNFVREMFDATGTPILNDTMAKLLENENNHDYIKTIISKDPKKAAVLGLYADGFILPSENYELTPFIKKKLDDILGSEITLETFGYLMTQCRTKPDSYEDFNEEKYNKIMNILQNMPQLQYYIDKVDVVKMFEGDFDPKDNTFSLNICLLGGLLKIKKTNSNDNTTGLIDKTIDKLISYMENDTPAYKISEEAKINFLNKIISSRVQKGAKYSEFEQTLIDSIPELENNHEGVKLAYSRNEFLNDINSICDSEEKMQTFIQKTGISPKFEEKDGKKLLIGYDGIIEPQNFDTENKFEQKAYEYTQRFLFNNSAQSGNNKLDEMLNTILQACPEFINIIGKKQHATHEWSVDIHTLLNLAYSFKNPDYLRLNSVDKAMLKFATLFHDISKPEGEIDKTHQITSSYMARNIIAKFIKNPNTTDRIIDLIQNHHWSEEFANAADKREKAMELAFRFKIPNDFEIAKIMAKSDIKSVSNNFYEAHKSALDDNNLAIIQEMLDRIYASGCAIISDTISTSRPNAIESVEIKGKKYKILNLRNISPNEDLQKYGFGPKTRKNDLNLLVHMIDTRNIKMSLYALSQLSKGSNKGVLSESLITPKYARTYCNRNYGVILSQINANTINAYYENQSSGTQKTYEKMYMAYFDEYKREYREEFKNFILEWLGFEPDTISNEEYVKLYKEHIIDKLSFSQFRKDKKFSLGGKEFSEEDLKAAIIAFQKELIDENGAFHNEILGCAPKINALITKEDNIEQIPDEFLEFAHKNNLPIVII